MLHLLDALRIALSLDCRTNHAQQRRSAAVDISLEQDLEQSQSDRLRLADRQTRHRIAQHVARAVAVAAVSRNSPIASGSSSRCSLARCVMRTVGGVERVDAQRQGGRQHAFPPGSFVLGSGGYSPPPFVC